MKKLIKTYSGLLLIGLLLEWWLLYYSGLKIPVYIPNTPIDIRGLLLIVLLFVVLITFIKRMVAKQKATSVLKLTISGALVCFIAEVIFQFTRVATENKESVIDKLIDFLYGVFVVTAFSASFAFLIAFQIKTRRTGLLVIFILLFMSFFVVLKTMLPLIHR